MARRPCLRHRNGSGAFVQLAVMSAVSSNRIGRRWVVFLRRPRRRHRRVDLVPVVVQSLRDVIGAFLVRHRVILE
ncbi:hypothetical protein SDC9_85268 [bioreactor metagenome]|uniref:Uncharacterized protein n=1 Tax=bioreactor metagenome TaxID=1076179 RepID=A0A644ZEB6_9ZZZZ